MWNRLTPGWLGLLQGIFSVFIFVLLASEDGFSTDWPEGQKAPGVYNGEGQAWLLPLGLFFLSASQACSSASSAA